MPRGNGTGPMGLGPRTGRGLGYCSGYPHPGYMNPYGFGRGLGRGWGRGFGRGWGRGWGWPSRFDYPYSPEPPTLKEEKEMLNKDLKALREEMKAIEERLKELETKKTKK
jgi:hypothetical protein